MLTSLFLMACSACFLMQPRTDHLRRGGITHRDLRSPIATIRKMCWQVFPQAVLTEASWLARLVMEFK